MRSLTFLALVAAAAALPAQSPSGGDTGGGLLPEAARRPQRGESPRYPRDAVIGELGAGEASADAYRFAGLVLDAVLANDNESPHLVTLEGPRREEILQAVSAIEPEKRRIGGGREEEDGGVSFLFRFIGREQGIAGELYIKLVDTTWLLDDILIEESQDAAGGGEGYRYDFTPYERFF